MRRQRRTRGINYPNLPGDRGYVVQKTDVFVRCPKDFCITSQEARVDSEVAILIVGKPIRNSHSNCIGESYHRQNSTWYAHKILKSNDAANDAVDLLSSGTPVPPKFKPPGQEYA